MSDLIDRQDAINAFEPDHPVDWYTTMIVDVLEDLPSVEPRKKGEWIVHKASDELHCGLVECPFCGEEMIAEADEYNFCPNCGADMRGESDG